MMTLDEYLDATFIHEDPLLGEIKRDIVDHAMPAIYIPIVTAATLHWLIKAFARRQALEIGALGGYSGVWLARALPSDGHLTSLELRSDYRDVALANVRRAGLADRVTFRVGPAAASLRDLEAENAQFDFFFIDADKENYPLYLDYALKLAEPGAIIAADNTLQGGHILDPDNHSKNVEAIRHFNRQVANHPHLLPLLLPIGDGLTLARYQP
ncbi:MAG: methyltransferase [Sulfobacillus acidophilus]|uniref:Methyltransferase n=1 Tax=Sulfobacillus acidophilus TaxID=53633 RepID=A0A2T2WMY9_9FIRM|nr:MAG: methyltransferase [Sulfobacillus acidophilus]